jgi:ABC-type glycerol-3-phosphate transport system substrate-binding protein
MSEMMDVVKANPDKQVMDYATKGRMLQILISYDQDSFIDWENGTCNFDNQDFIDVLEFCNTLPDDDDDSVWDDDDSTPVKVKKGKVLLANVSLSEPESVQEYQSYFTGESNFIGFPSNSGNGAYIDAFGLYGITSKSDVKEGAWAYIESSLTDVNENEYYYGVSPLKSVVEKQIAKSQEVSYVTDENGEYVVDENGEKIPEGTSSISYGDWDYTYHPVTDEEAEIFRNIINNAEPSQTSDQKVFEIIQEEAGAYFSGQKSPEDVAGIIQSRINIYINESR